MAAFVLLASSAFSFVALLVENRRSREISKAMLLPIVWFVLSVSKPIDFWLNPTLMQQSTADYTEGSMHTRIVLTALIVCGLLVLATRTIDWSSFFLRNRFFCVLLAFMLVSIAWSDFKYIALKRYIRLFGDLVMVMIVMTEKEPVQAVKKMVMNSAYLLIPLSIVLAKYFPLYGREYNWDGSTIMWAGVASQKNGLGIFCALATLTLISSVKGSQAHAGKERARQFFRFLLLLLAVYTLVGGGESYPSATAMIVVPIGLIVYFLLLKTGNTSLGRSKFNAILVFVVAFVLLGSSLQTFFLGLIGRDPTLTGRDVIWSGLIEIGMEHPVLGVGFGSFWMRPLFGVNQAHNGYIEIFLQIGVFGIVLTALFLMEAYRNAWSGDTSETAFRIMILIVVLVQNYSEASLLRANSCAGIIILMVLVSMNKVIRPVEREEIVLPNKIVEYLKPKIKKA
jgi:exopolysaccharide production protein ExoQ